MTGVARAAIRAYPLDERCVYTIHVSVEEPTTCVFPGAITGLVGARVSETVQDEPPVLLSHQAGAEYFSLRALKPDATGALNVLFRGKVYVLSLVAGGEPDRAVAFIDEPARTEKATRLAPEALRGLLERAKQRARFAAQYPAIAMAMEHAERTVVTPYRDFTATVVEAFRFEREEVVILRVRLANPGSAPVRYDPERLAVRVDREVYPAALAEASGAIPAQGSSEVFVVVQGGTVPLSVHEDFSVIVPTLP